MEIEKLIEKLRDAGWTNPGLTDKQSLEWDAATALERLQAENDRLKEEVQQMRWVPVEERLPEKMGEYIVCVDGEVKSDAYCVWDGVERWLCYNGTVSAVDFDPYSGKLLRDGPYPRVTHWMHLPQPPKEEKKDD